MFLLHIIIPFLFILSCLFILLYDDLGLVSFAEFTTNNLPYLNADRKKVGNKNRNSDYSKSDRIFEFYTQKSS